MIRGGGGLPRRDVEEQPGGELARLVAAVVDARARAGALSLDDASPDEAVELEVELAREIEALREWSLRDEGDPVRAIVDQLVRAHRETGFGNQQPDDPDAFAIDSGELDALDVLYEVLADLCWMAELPQRAAELERRARRGQRGVREGELADRAGVMRALIDELGGEPWALPSTSARLRAAHRLSVMGANLRDIARGMPSDGTLRRAVRRVARATWSLDHVRLVEAGAVWSELDGAVRALEHELDPR